MNISISSINGTVVFDKAQAVITDETKEAFGRSRCDWTCQEDKAKLWPISFDLVVSGTFRSKKEGKLLVTITIAASMKKGAKLPELEKSVTVNLVRESVNKTLGGWSQHDFVNEMVAEKKATSTVFQVAALTAIQERLKTIADDESKKAKAHIDRAAAAQGIINTINKK